MDDKVTISIPPKTEYLKAASEFFNALAKANEKMPKVIHSGVAQTSNNMVVTNVSEQQGVSHFTVEEAPDEAIGPHVKKSEVPEVPEAPEAPEIYIDSEIKIPGTTLMEAPEVPEVPEVPEAPAAPEEITTAFKGAEPNLNAVDLDSKGRPWDERIHTKAKTKIKKTGEWKLTRGVDPGLVTQVINELDGKLTPVADLAPKAPTNEATQADKNVVFMSLMQVVTGLTTPPAGTTVPKVSIDAINAIAAKNGAANIPALLQMPIETINAVKDEVDALCLTLQ